MFGFQKDKYDGKMRRDDSIQQFSDNTGSLKFNGNNDDGIVNDEGWIDKDD